MQLEWISIQGSGEWNEDAVVINERERLYGVIDGATSLVPFRGANNETGGRLASQIIKSCMESPIPGEYAGLEPLMKGANRRLGEEMKQGGVQLGTKQELWTAGIALIRINETHIEFAQAGDCMIIALYRDGSLREITRDHVAHIDHESMLLWKQGISDGVSSKEELWEKVKPRIYENKHKMNTMEGYSVMNGLPEAELFFEYGKLNRIQLQELLLVTDGLFYPEQRPSEDKKPGWDQLVQHVRTEGLRAYADWLIREEDDDSDCIRYPRFKKSDDKSGIWIRFDDGKKAID